jgi:hypothetical protein
MTLSWIDPATFRLVAQCLNKMGHRESPHACKKHSWNSPLCIFLQSPMHNNIQSGDWADFFSNLPPFGGTFYYFLIIQTLRSKRQKCTPTDSACHHNGTVYVIDLIKNCKCNSLEERSPIPPCSLSHDRGQSKYETEASLISVNVRCFFHTWPISAGPTLL